MMTADMAWRFGMEDMSSPPIHCPGQGKEGEAHSFLWTKTHQLT
jgi:hypothetical protein